VIEHHTKKITEELSDYFKLASDFVEKRIQEQEDKVKGIEFSVEQKTCFAYFHVRLVQIHWILTQSSSICTEKILTIVKTVALYR
jgi:hypothetical protein